MCSYYWQWDGGDRLAYPATLLQNQCDEPYQQWGWIEFGSSYKDEVKFALVYEPVFTPGQFYEYTSSTTAMSEDAGGLGFTFKVSRGILGSPTPEHKQAIQRELGITNADYIRHGDWVVVAFLCEPGDSARLRISVTRSVLIETLYAPFGQFWTTGYILNYSETSTGIVPHSCIVDEDLVCNLNTYTPPSIAYAQTPIEDAVISWDESRAYYKEQDLSDWAYTTAPASVYPRFAPEKRPSDVPASLDDWKEGGSVPLVGQVTLKRKASCQPSAPCDCTQSLSGMIVTFEGQEFTCGQLDSFFNAGTWWEETSAGVFRRRDTESCDGSLNQTVKQATIECTQINGVDTWVCYLDHTCEERDDLTCPGPPDAGRNKQWTGIFECDENGKPTGSPGSLEVDSDTTTGTPAAECVDALTVPSISISAPP
jgi:hypothetical protein